MSFIFSFKTGCVDFICGCFCGSSSVIISRIDSELLECPGFEFLEG